MMDPQLAGCIALAIFLGLVAQIHTGEIRLGLAPPGSHHIAKSDDPRRFWAFIAAESTLFVAVMAQGISGLV
jgi:hypothetical protein